MNTTAAGDPWVVTGNISKHVYEPTAHPIVRIHLLGPMRATSYLGDDVLPRAKKARAALGYLCLASGARVPRARIASMLWDRVDAAQARTRFRQAVVGITSAMGPLAEELISTGRATVSLNTDVCWIDVLALLKSRYSDSMRADLAVLCVGQLLDGLDEVSASFAGWLANERIRFKEKLSGWLDTVLQRIDRGDFDAKKVASVARRLILFDPTHRGASLALMRALAKLDEPGEALREFERSRQALWEAFHVKPTLESEKLYKVIRGQMSRKSTATSAAIPNIHRLLPGRQRLRVGVLPFDAAHSENERDLAFSLSHEVAAALARFRWFDVIAPVSMLRRPVTALLSEDIFQQQQLDYAIDGVIEQRGNKYRISVRLLDLTRSTQPVWSDRLELAMNELHRLNEMVTGRVVASIDPVILFIEGQPRRKERYGANALLLLAIPLIYSMERQKYHQAGQLIERATAMEPDNAMALTWLAYWHLWNAGQCWTPDLGRGAVQGGTSMLARDDTRS
jgi:DNA-binding SARP family transcriptional activator